jgi:hypothetical protein
MEELLKGFVDLGAGFSGRVALLGEEIAVVVGLVSAIAVAGHAPDVAEGRINVRRRHLECRLRRQGR